MTTKNEQTELPTTKDTIKVAIPYFQTPNAIFDLDKIENIYQLSILLYLHRCGNQGAEAFPSYKTMALKCRMSRIQVIRTIRSLIDHNLLIKTATPHKSNRYTIDFSGISQTLGGISQILGGISQIPYKEPVIKNSSFPISLLDIGAKALASLSELKSQLNEAGNKIGFLVDTFKYLHRDATPADLNGNLGGRIAGMVKVASGDAELVLAKIYQSQGQTIQGSRLNYIQAMLKPKGDQRRLLPTTKELEEDFNYD